MTNETFDIDEWARSAPKIVLHTHLEGSLDTATLRELRLKNGLEESPLSSPHYLASTDFTKNWETFRQVFRHFCDHFREPQDLTLAAVRYALRLRESAVFYAEIIVSPWKHIEKGMCLSDLNTALALGADEALKVGVRLRFLMDIVRKEAEPIDEMLEWCCDRRHSVFSGVSFSGGLGSVPRSAYATAAHRIRRSGLPITAHCGELEGPTSVYESFDYLQADRLGHGVRALEDAVLLRHISLRRTHLEVCPTANARLGVGLPNGAAVGALANGQVNFSINPDDEGIFGTTVPSEYQSLYRRGVLTPPLIRKCMQNAIDAAFCEASERSELVDAHRSWWEPRSVCNLA